MSDLLLIPRPQRLQVRGEGAPSGARVVEDRAEEIPAQGFELTIDPEGVRIRYADDAGRRYARSLLDQIRSQTGDVLPGVFVRDHPDFPVRAYMLDISRDRVPTCETLARLIEILSLARINQLQLYTEHTFAYRDHEVVWRDASPVTRDDIRWLDDLCGENGIELVANQNCFGHMNRWLVHDAYRLRAECPDGSRAPSGAELPPWTLAPTPDNAAFALELLDELLPNFTSARVNIGCDEPFDLGQGKSAEDVAKRGKATVYLEHLDRIARPLVERGYEVQVWGDVLRDDPQLAAKLLPSGVVAVPWHYEQPWPDELREQLPASTREALATLAHDPMDGFRSQIAPLADIDMPFWIAPGTSTWNSLVGRIDNALGNLLDAAEIGLEFGASGYLITDWGDNGHHQPPAVSFGPIVYGGAVSWSHRTNHDLDVAKALDAFVFEDVKHSLGGALDSIGRVWRSTGQLAFNGSPIFRALVPRSTMSFGDIDPARCRATVELIEDVIGTIEGASPRSSDAEAVKRELGAAARLARHGTWRMMRRVGGEAPGDDELRGDLADAIERQRDAWMARSRPGGLADSLARLERTLAEYG
jgi:hypothetical protein